MVAGNTAMATAMATATETAMATAMETAMETAMATAMATAMETAMEMPFRCTDEVHTDTKTDTDLTLGTGMARTQGGTQTTTSIRLIYLTTIIPIQRGLTRHSVMAYSGRMAGELLLPQETMALQAIVSPI